MSGKSRTISDWVIGWQATNVELRADEWRHDHLPLAFKRAHGHTNPLFTRGCRAATFRTPRPISDYRRGDCNFISDIGHTLSVPFPILGQGRNPFDCTKCFDAERVHLCKQVVKHVLPAQ
jgi:hypothetical protein